MYTGHEMGADFRRQASVAKSLGRDIHNVGIRPFNTSPREQVLAEETFIRKP